MTKTGKTDSTIIQKIIDPMNPFGQGMLQQAINVSVVLLAEEYNITKLYSKEGQLLMVY